MTTTPDRRFRGVTSLEDLRERCYVDPDTGCWIWRMAVDMCRGTPSPRVWVPCGLWDRRPVVTTAARAAWFLAGRPEPENGAYVCRAKCSDPLCIAPHHGSTSSPADAARNRAGRRRRNARTSASPDVLIANKRLAMAQSLPPETVRDIEAMAAAGETAQHIAATHRISAAVVYRILRGEHQHAAGRPALLRGASVFAWGARQR